MWSPTSSSSSSPITPPRLLARRATTMFNRVRDVDTSFIEVGHKLANEFHQIFHSPTSLCTNGKLADHRDDDGEDFKQGNLVVDLAPSPVLASSALWFGGSSVSNLIQYQQQEEESWLPSCSYSSTQSTPRLTTSSSLAGSSESLLLEPSLDYFDAEQPVVQIEVLEDPYCISPISSDDEEEERRNLRNGSARAAFGLPPRPRFRHGARSSTTAGPAAKTMMNRTRSDEEMSTSTKKAIASPESKRVHPPARVTVLRPSKSLILPKSKLLLSFPQSHRSPPYQLDQSIFSCPPPLPPPRRRSH